MLNKLSLCTRFFTLLWLIVNSHTLSAQRISISFNNADFFEFVDRIEETSTYKFYFDSNEVDTLRFNIQGEYLIQDLLSKALDANNLNYAIDFDNNIFITRSRIIQTKLPPGALTQESDSLHESAAFDASSFQQKQSKGNQDKQVIIVGSKSFGLRGNASITGHVIATTTGESLPGVLVFVEALQIGVSTDAMGYYKLNLPRGTHTIKFQSVGLKTGIRNTLIYSDGKLDVELEEGVTSLSDVIISSDRDVAISSVQMGREKMDIKTLRQMPMVLGETDILKLALAIPGVQSTGEGANGLNVRGGASNQNLILFNGATIYNPNHLFGFFSTFNPDVVKSMELYKSGFEANYGGRLSSILEVASRDGNLKKVAITGGLSPVTGRLTLEGPILKDKTSFLIAGRSTYSDWILKKIKSSLFNNSAASFYDLNLHLTHKHNDNNQFTLSAYQSKDEFRLNSDTLFNYEDKNVVAKWTHKINQRLFSDLTASISIYEYGISNSANPINAFRLNSTIEQAQLDYNFKHIINNSNTLHYGVSSRLYRLNPGDYLPDGSKSLVVPVKIQEEKGIENALYVGNSAEVSRKLSIYFGIRFSHYSSIGKKEVFKYISDAPIELNSLIDTVQVSGLIKTYSGLEPRLNARYSLNSKSSVKFSYSRTMQYIQMLSNNTSVAPTDVWKLSDEYIQPQQADQVSIGWFRSLHANTFELSVEAYYKHIGKATDFQNGATLLKNNHLETDVLNAKGKAYGVEILLKKNKGRLNGWFSYTWSRAMMKADSKFDIERVNDGNYYPGNFDKPHSLNVITNYKFSRRVNVSINGTYSSGRPITLPLVKYNLDGSNRLDYSDRNAARIPDYFRTDISINLEGNHKLKKFAHYSWSLAIYNLTARRNAYSIFFRNEGGQIKGYKLSVFAQAIPTLAYNFKI